MEEGINTSRKSSAFTIDRVGGAILVMLGLFVVWERRVLPLGTAQRPGPGYFPLLLAVLLIVFGAIMILRGKKSRAFRTISWSEAPHAVPILGCCVFVALFMERIGYRISLFLVLVFCSGLLSG